MSRFKVIFFCIPFVLLISCHNHKKTFQLVPYFNIEIDVDGKIDEKVWSKIDQISGLSSPWNNRNSKDHTKFKCFCSERLFNFYFDVDDTNVIINNPTNELDVADGDRVELFFTPSLSLDKYYCIEIAPNGNILDYMAEYYRKFDYSWNFQQNSIAVKMTNYGYVVEGHLSLEELYTLGINLAKGSYIGIFRADFTEAKKDSVIWYSWINPKVKNPDFHLPSAFGFIKCKGAK